MTEEEIDSLEQEADSLYEQYCKLKDKVTQERRKNINLDIEGEYVKYKDELSGITHYCLVDWVTEDKMRYTGFTYVYLIRGIGFRGRFTGYSDDTFFDWDYSYEFHIFDNSVKGFKKKVDSIEIISRDEFLKAFGECVNQASEFNTMKVTTHRSEKN